MHTLSEDRKSIPLASPLSENYPDLNLQPSPEPDQHRPVSCNLNPHLDLNLTHPHPAKKFHTNPHPAKIFTPSQKISHPPTPSQNFTHPPTTSPTHPHPSTPTHTQPY